MKVEPIHHVPMRPEYRSPFSAAYAIEGGRLIFFSGCCTVPTYHKHPHDPDEERQWLKGDFREQTERTFAHIKEILDAAGARMKDVLKLTIFTTQMDGQNILNEISARYFGNENPPARSLIGVPTLAHPGMLIEIEGVAAARQNNDHDLTETVMTKKSTALTRRALVAAGAGGALASLGAPFIRSAQAAPVKIRYATGGGIGPNEMETIIYLDWMQKNVLKGYGKDYTVEMTFTRGTPEAGTLLAAGQADMATLSFAVFATSVLKNIVPGGITIVSDNYQDGRAGFAQNTFFVLEDSAIRSTQDLKGKKVGINAFGSAVDLALRIKLKKDGIDPRRDLTIVEVAFPNQAAAIREKRIDCGILILPFMNAELRKGNLRALFTGGDAFGPYAVIFQIVTNEFLKKNPDAVKSFLADYVRGLHWFYDPANRKKAVEITAEFTKSPADVLDSYFMTERDYYRDRNACVSVAAIQTPIDAMHSEGLIDRPVKVSDFLDMSYLPHPC